MMRKAAVASSYHANEPVGKTGVTKKGETAESAGEFFSPCELALRWRCSRSTVDRIAQRARLTRLCLGDGRNGIIRYIRKEVEKYEQSRMLNQ
jgi:hypothetical protein